MLKRRHLMAFALVTVAGLPVVVASVPRSSENDTAIYTNLHEIKVQKVKSLSFDSDLDRLSAQEKKHREALPARISAPMERVMNTPYRAGTYSKKPVRSQRFYRNQR